MKQIIILLVLLLTITIIGCSSGESGITGEKILAAKLYPI